MNSLASFVASFAADEICTKNEQNRISKSSVLLQLLFYLFFCSTRVDDSKSFFKGEKKKNFKVYMRSKVRRFGGSLWG